MQFFHCPEKSFKISKCLQNNKQEKCVLVSKEDTFHWAPQEGKWLEDF